MENSIALVSSADSRYFPLLVEWLQSVRRFSANEDKDICIFNAGLEPDQVQYLRDQGCIVEEPDWPCDIPEQRVRGKEFLKSCVCRPFIPQIFKGYSLYIWMDSDTWLQDYEALDLLVRGAKKSALAIAPQADRNYGKVARVQWLGPFVRKVRSFYFSNARKAFSGKVARKLLPYPTLNAGVFALRADAPHWTKWQELIVKALRKGKVFTAEQLTLGMLVHLEGYKAEFLPSWCNWLCETLPAWDDQEQCFVEPSLPHHPIGIMHLSGHDDMRVKRALEIDVQTTDEGAVHRSLRYPYFDGEKLAPVSLKESVDAAE